jgi:plastocyanin
MKAGAVGSGRPGASGRPAPGRLRHEHAEHERRCGIAGAHDQTKTFKVLRKSGTYHYICSIHQFMMGTIVVK